MTQWSQSSILGDQLNYWITGDSASTATFSTTYTTMKDLGMNFNVPPEFVKPGEFTVAQGMTMSKSGGYVSGDLSLFYPMNMYTEFYSYVTTGQFANLTLQQSNYFVDWFTAQATYNTEQAQGSFIARSVTTSYAFVESGFNNEAVARNMGYQMNYACTGCPTTPQTCTYFWT